MDWKDIGSKVSSYAPVIGGILGGPPGAAIGGVVQLIAKLFGVKETELTPAKLDNILSADPTAYIKLRELEIKEKELILTYQNQQLSMFLADVQSARGRETEITKVTGTRDINLYILAWTVIIGFFALMYVLTFQSLPDANVGPVNQLYGVLGTGFGLVLGYFFGSSRGSSENRAMLDKALTTNGK